jgi:integrase
MQPGRNDGTDVLAKRIGRITVERKAMQILFAVSPARDGRPRAVAEAVREAGLAKRAGPHTLRHSFATPLESTVTHGTNAASRSVDRREARA